MKPSPTIEELDDNDVFVWNSSRGERSNRTRGRLSKKSISSTREFVNTQDDTRGSFKFSYKAARFEQGWLLDSLGDFYEHRWISDVLRRVKGGKEASVYLCSAGSEVEEPLIAAKVYRPRSLRNMKNDHAYREGRGNLDGEGNVVLNEGMQHAMAKKTEYGKTLLHQSWIAFELTTLKTLHAAGADVPRPYAMAGNAILMEYIGDARSPAPTLNEISLEKNEARQLFERVITNIEVLLSQDCIHGDLSAYNILYWDGNITLIDFPQVISPRINRNAFSIFQRDVSKVCEYFQKQGIQSNPRKISADLWSRYNHRQTPEVDIRLLDADDPKDREAWKKQKAR